MKRMIALLLAIFMVVGMFPTTVLAAETDPAISFSTTFADTMTVGDTFTVTADLANNPGIAAITLSLKWNDAVVKFTGFEKYEDDFPVSEVLEARGWTVIPNHELGIIVSYRTTNNSDNGSLFTANFEIVGSGDAGIGLKMADETEYEVVNENSEPVALALDFSALEGLTVAAPEEPGCDHSYVAGICTQCGEADPDYVAPSVDVTLSLSKDAEFMVGKDTDEVMAFKNITVPYFDLGLYGLEEYYFSSESYGDDGDGLPGSDLEPGTAAYADGKVTLLHLYLYALEKFYCGLDEKDIGKGHLAEAGLIGTEVFTISGGVGSSYLNQFWDGDCNLNYYVNYEYPLASEGWGATCDQILLRDGDMVTLGNFSDWSFYADPYSIFNYIVSDKSAATQGEEVTLTLYYAGPNMGSSYDTAQNLNTYCVDVYCVPANVVVSPDVTSWTRLGTSDENGQLVVDTTNLAPGEYIVAVAGQPGEYTEAICSTPGGVKLTVKACQHNYVDGVCGNCGAADPDYVAPESKNVTVWTGELCNQYSSLDLYVSEWYIEDGKDFVLGSATTYEYLKGGNVNTATFVDGDQIKVGSKINLGATIEGEDKDQINSISGNVATIQSYGYFMDQMRVTPTDYYTISNTFAIYPINKFELADVKMVLGEEASAALTLDSYISNNTKTYLLPLVEWTSSDESVVTVEGGTITAVGLGTATITATFGTDSVSKTATCEVTVESGNVTVWTGELSSKYSNLDLYVTEWYIENGRSFVLGSVTTYEYLPGGNVTTSTFVDADQIGVGANINLGAVIEGEDAETGLKEITGNVATIQSYNYCTQQMRVTPTDYNAITNSFSIYRVGTLALADVTMANDETVDLTLTDSDQILTNNWALKYLGNLVEWTSSDESVVKVVVEEREEFGNKYMVGKLVPQGLGTATITAKIGNETISKTATCTVTVVCEHDYFNGICTKCSAVDPDYVAIETIQLTSPSMKIETDEATGETVSVLSLVAGGSEKLTAVLNEGATQGVIWSSENEGIAKVDENGVVTAVSNGTTTITATAGDTATTFAARNNPVMASVKVTVTDLPEGEYYTVTLAADKTVVAGETIEIPVTVGHSDYLHYNAWDMTFTYDSTALKLTTESSSETFTVTAVGNTIRVQGYGENLDADTAAFTLTFEALKAGSTELTLDSAKVDNAGHAIGNDAPEATVIDDLTVLTITGYPVTLPEGFVGEGVAAPGKDYPFSAPEDYYDYTVEIKVGGETVAVTPVDGTWTIPGDAVTGEIVITQTGKEGKTFEVDLGDYMNGKSTAQHGTAYAATLNKEAGYTYSVTVKIGGETYNGAEVSGETYTIPGGDITGKIEFIVERDVVASTDLAVTFTGTGAGAADGNPTTVKNGEDYVLTLTKAKGYLYTVKVNGQEVEPNAEGKYVIEKVTAALTIEIERMLDLEGKVSVHEYVNLDGKTVFLVLIAGELEDGNHYTYDGNAMYYSFVYEAWATLTVESGSFTAADASAKVDAAAGNKMTISSAECDVNNTGTVDINDAQLAYDVYKGNYEDIADIGMAKYLWADVNADMKVDVTDAQMVVANIK